MYSYIIGDVKSIKDNYIIVDNNGIGYRIFTSANTMRELSTYETAMIHTEYIVREDGAFLYGFDTERELDLFNSLRSVSSVGPKAAISILSSLTVDEVKYSIWNNDVDALTKAPGIGKKTASRIILELKDKLDNDFVIPMEKELVATNQDMDFAVDALVNLGYMKNDVTKFIQRLEDPSIPLEEIIKLAMRTLEYKG